MSVDNAREQLELAEGRWQDAIKEHAQPPPDAGYARRLRALADAAAQEQAAYRYADEQGFGWRPGPAWLPPQELRPASWRSALAPAEVWERMLEPIPAPFYHDLFAAAVHHGVQMNPDYLDFAAYYPALRRMLEVMRDARAAR